MIDTSQMLLNINTNELEYYGTLISFETDSESFSQMSDEEIEQAAKDLKDYIDDLISDGTLLEMYEFNDENGHHIGYQSDDGETVIYS